MQQIIHALFVYNIIDIFKNGIMPCFYVICLFMYIPSLIKVSR